MYPLALFVVLFGLAMTVWISTPRLDKSDLDEARAASLARSLEAFHQAAWRYVVDNPGGTLDVTPSIAALPSCDDLDPGLPVAACLPAWWSSDRSALVRAARVADSQTLWVVTWLDAEAIASRPEIVPARTAGLLIAASDAGPGRGIARIDGGELVVESSQWCSSCTNEQLRAGAVRLPLSGPLSASSLRGSAVIVQAAR